MSMISPLLNLPLEVFQQIVSVLIQNVGICEAWKLRGICRTFSVEIHDALFARQKRWELRSFLRNRNFQKLRNEKLGVYIFNWMDKPLYSDCALSARLRELTNFLASQLDLDTSEGAICARKLCEVLVRSQLWEVTDFFMSYFERTYYSKIRASFDTPTTIDTKIFAAVAVGATKLADQLLRSFGGSAPTCSMFGDSVIVTAVHSRNLDMIPMLFEHYPAATATPMWTPLPATAAAEIGNIEFLEWFLKNFTHGRMDRLGWLDTAVRNGNIHAADVILQAKRKRKVSLTMTEVHEICMYGTREVVSHYVAAGKIDPRKVWQTTSTLMLTLDRGNVDAADVMIKAGADINQCFLVRKTALYLAAQRRQYDFVHLLLSRGAVPDLKTWAPTGVARQTLEYVMADQ